MNNPLETKSVDELKVLAFDISVEVQKLNNYYKKVLSLISEKQSKLPRDKKVEPAKKD
jgi:hypothetical protein